VAPIDRQRLADLLEAERVRHRDRTSLSKAEFDAADHLFGRVPMTWMNKWSGGYPLYLAGAHGNRITDVDGNEYVDFALGDTAAMAGHSPEPTVAAVTERIGVKGGVTTMMPSDDAEWVAAELTRRFGISQWSFSLSATDANRWALRIARLVTGRPKVMAFSYCYHGSVDETFVIMGPNGETEPRGGNVGPSVHVSQTSRVAEFNDIASVERALAHGDVAVLVMEPALTNIGIVLPEPGFLEDVRALTKKHGIVLIFDEVKTGICTARGGAVERWGVVPDMETLGKAIAGGTPCGAIGGTEEIMAKVNDGTVFQVGTYSGNPLSMAAARASWEQVMTDEAYARLNALNDRIIAGCDAVCAKHDFPGYTVGISSKGCVNFASGKITDYESFIKEQDADLVALAWLYNINRGLIIAPGREEEWTLSITHTDADVDLFVDAFEELVRDVTA